MNYCLVFISVFLNGTKVLQKVTYILKDINIRTFTLSYFIFNKYIKNIFIFVMRILFCMTQLDLGLLYVRRILCSDNHGTAFVGILGINAEE